jgi:hypothetical protein
MTFFELQPRATPTRFVMFRKPIRWCKAEVLSVNKGVLGWHAEVVIAGYPDATTFYGTT